MTWPFFLPDRIGSRTEELRTSEERKGKRTSFHTSLNNSLLCYSGGKKGLPGLL